MSCQQTSNSTQNNDEERRAALVQALERAQTEVRAGRKYIEGLKEQVRSKESLIERLDARDAVRVKAQESLQAEVRDLQAAIASQKENLKIKEAETDYLKKELSKVNKKLRNAHTREKIFAGIAAALAAVLLLR